MLNINDTEKKIRECLTDLRNHSQSPRHLEEVGCLISENFGRIKSSKKKCDSNLRKLNKKDVEIIENILSCIRSTEERRNEHNLDLHKREKKFQKIFDKNMKTKKYTRFSRDGGKHLLKKVLSESSSDKELIVLHRRQPKLKKRLRRQKAHVNVHDALESVSMCRLSMPKVNKYEGSETFGNGQIQTEKNVKSHKSQINKELKDNTMKNKIGDIDNLLVSELGTAVNLSKKIIKQLDLIPIKNRPDVIITDGFGNCLNLCIPEDLASSFVHPTNSKLKLKKKETEDKKESCSDVPSLLQCSQTVIMDIEDKQNISEVSKAGRNSKQSITVDKSNSKHNMKSKLKKNNSDFLHGLKNTVQMKMSNMITIVNDIKSTNGFSKSSITKRKQDSLKLKTKNSKLEVKNSVVSLVSTHKRENSLKRKTRKKIKQNQLKNNISSQDSVVFIFSDKRGNKWEKNKITSDSFSEDKTSSLKLSSNNRSVKKKMKCNVASKAKLKSNSKKSCNKLLSSKKTETVISEQQINQEFKNKMDKNSNKSVSTSKIKKSCISLEKNISSGPGGPKIVLEANIRGHKNGVYDNTPTLDMKRNKPCINFQLTDPKLTPDNSKVQFKLIETDGKHNIIPEEIHNPNQNFKKPTHVNTNKNLQSTDHLVNFSKLEHESGHSSKNSIDISINKNTKNSNENVLSVVIKHKKSVQSSGIMHNANKYSNLYLLSNKINNTQSYRVVPQSYEITKQENFGIHENKTRKNCFDSRFSQNMNKIPENVFKKPIIENSTMLKDTKLNTMYHQTACSEYLSNQSYLKERPFTKPQIHRLNCFTGKNVNRRKFKNQAISVRYNKNNANTKHINKNYISVANVRIPINLASFNYKKSNFSPNQKPSAKLQFIRRKSLSSIGRYYHHQGNDLKEFSIPIQDNMQCCESHYNQKCNIPVGKFLFHLDLESNNLTSSLKCKNETEKNLFIIKNQNRGAKNETKFNNFFTVIDDNSKQFKQNDKNCFQNSPSCLQRMRTCLPETRKTDFYQFVEGDLNTPNITNIVNNQKTETLCIEEENSLFKLQEENNQEINEKSKNDLKFNSVFNLCLDSETKKQNFIKIVDETSEAYLKEATIKKNTSKTTIKENEKINDSKNVNDEDEASILNLFSGLLLENYKRDKFIKVVDNINEINQIPPMMDAEIQTDSEDFNHNDFSQIQQLFADELKQNRKLFIKNLDDSEDEKDIEEHYEAILQLVNNLFDITLKKIGQKTEITAGIESSKNPEYQILSKLNDIVSIMQNLDQNSKYNFVKDVENGNEGDMINQTIKPIENSDNINSITQTDGSGDNYTVNIPLIKAQMLLNQFNIYIEMIEMLKQYQGRSISRIETLNEFYDVINRIDTTRKNFCKTCNVENLCLIDNNLPPCKLSTIESYLIKDRKDPPVENRRNFFSILHEEMDDNSKFHCKNPINQDCIVVENMSNLNEKNPFFVVLADNVTSDLKENCEKDVENVCNLFKTCEKEYAIGSDQFSRALSKSENKELLNEKFYNFQKSEDVNETNVEMKFYKIAKSQIDDGELIDKELYGLTKSDDLDRKLIEREFCKLRKFEDTDKNLAERNFFNFPKSEGTDKIAQKEFYNFSQSFNLNNHSLSCNLENINVNTIVRKELSSRKNNNESINEKVKNEFETISGKNNCSLVSIGIQTDTTIIQQEQNENCECNTKHDTLYSQVDIDKINGQQDINFKNKINKQLNILFSKDIKKNKFDINKKICKSSQTNRTFVENFKTVNKFDSSVTKGFGNLQDKSVGQTFGSGKDKTNERIFFEPNKGTILNDMICRNNSTSFNNSVKTTQNLVPEKLNSSSNLLKTFTGIENSNFKVNKNIETETNNFNSKCCNNCNVEFRQNDTDLKDIYNVNQKDDISENYSFNIDEYKNDILLNYDLLSDSDLEEHLSEQELFEDNSNWLTIKNINCIQSSDNNSSDNIGKNIMRLQMDLCLNECLQIELSSDSVFDTMS